MKNLLDIKTHSKTIKSAIVGTILLVLSLFINYLAGTYATLNASNTVRDIILDNLPTYNVNFIYIEGIVMFFIFVGILCVCNLRRIPFVIKALSLFIIIRSFFIVLTHLGPIVPADPANSELIVGIFTFDSDFFFSGHTGFPFLMSLIFWDNKILRITFLILSILFGFAMLLGHLHYSIDVFAAFFITYGVYKISEKFFPEDYELLKSSIAKRPIFLTENGFTIQQEQEILKASEEAKKRINISVPFDNAKDFIDDLKKYYKKFKK
jgi:hypothetical protein